MSFNFTTLKNYLKRDASTGSTVISAPATATGYGSFFTSHTVNHNLGYIPIVRVYYEPIDNGEIYPACGSRIAGTTTGLGANPTMCFYELTTTQLIIRLESNTSKTGTRSIYWIIYKDFPS